MSEVPICRDCGEPKDSQMHAEACSTEGREDVCPVCGADLKSQGWPYGHQDAETGEDCPWTWGD